MKSKNKKVTPPKQAAPSKSRVAKDPARIMTAQNYTGGARVSTADERLLQMVQWAMETNRPMEYINALFAEIHANKLKAEKALFTQAKTEFQRALPDLRRNVHVDRTDDDGYSFMDLEEIIKVVREPLANAGFAYDWDLEQKAGEIIVTFVLTHVGGHSKSVQLRFAADESGGLTGIQAMGSTITYLRRYTFTAGVGISSGTKDDDGAKAKKPKGKHIIPPASDREYMDTITAVSTGKMNVDDCLKHRSYTADQLVNLRGLEQNFIDKSMMP